MFKFLRNRWLHLARFLGALIALGVGIYQVEPPAPMCEIDAGVFELLSFADGRRLITATSRHLEFEEPGPKKSITVFRMRLVTGPIQVLDTRTGEELARHLGTNEELRGMTFSHDMRFAAAKVSEIGAVPRKYDHPLSSFALVDLGTFGLRELPVHDRSRIGPLILSPKGRLLASAGKDKSIRVYDFATGQVLAERADRELVNAGDDFVCCRQETVPGKMNLEVWDPRANSVVGSLLDVADSYLHQSSDGKYLVFRDGSAGKDGAGQWIIWNTRTARIEGKFESAGDIPRDASLDHTLTLKDNDAQGEHLEIREMPTGRFIERNAPFGILLEFPGRSIFRRHVEGGEPRVGDARNADPEGLMEAHVQWRGPALVRA